MIERQVEITNRLGLHARAAARLVHLASQFESDIELEVDGEHVNGKSILGVLLLAAGQGSRLTLRAQGPDAEQAVSAIEELFRNRFGESE
jgi:phosphocarrier protein